MSSRPILVAPSLLACDFTHLAEEVRRVEEAGADWLHVDVMDGHFVPNITVGPVVVSAIRRASRLPLDVHLMINDPQRYLHPFIEAGATYLTVHLEAPGMGGEAGVFKTVDTIRKLGAGAGVSVRPRTGAAAIKPFLDAVDLVLVMSVEPGFGGQVFMPEVVPKIRQLRAWYAGHLSVDGGLNAETGRLVREAGVNILVAGTYVFRAASCGEAIRALRGA